MLEYYHGFISALLNVKNVFHQKPVTNFRVALSLSMKARPGAQPFISQ